MMSEMIRLYDAILIDISNKYHAAFSTSVNLTTKLEDGSKLVTGGIYTTIKGIQKLRRERLVPGGQVFYLCDSGLRSSQGTLDETPMMLRRNIDPEYKANRKPHPDPSFYRGLEIAISILLNLYDRSYVVRCDGYEADDLVPVTIRRYTPDNAHVLLVSTDTDWCRALSDSVDVLRGDKLVNVKSFTEDYGFSPQGCGLQIYKSFRGDSDNVPKGVEGIREKDLVRLINDYPSIDDVRDKLDDIEFLSTTWKNTIKERWPRILLNYRLIDFLPMDDATFDAGLHVCSFKPRSLRAQYDALGFDVDKLDARVASEDYARVISDSKSSGFFIRPRVKRL
jgi:5'-3' exonuclease